MKQFFKKWWHVLFILYFFIHFPCFSYLEATITTEYNLIYCPLDDMIPFCEYFIIPYYFWFLFVSIACVYFFFRSQKESICMYSYLVIGMGLSLIIFRLFPSGLGDIRPTEFARDNFCTDLVKFLYSSDTSTNVFPSLHIYNTLVVAVAVFKSETFGKYRTPVRIIVTIISVLICASTLFLKQHSVYDVLAGFALAIILYPFMYVIGPIPKIASRKYA